MNKRQVFLQQLKQQHQSQIQQYDYRDLIQRVQNTKQNNINENELKISITQVLKKQFQIQDIQNIRCNIKSTIEYINVMSLILADCNLTQEQQQLQKDYLRCSLLSQFAYNIVNIPNINELVLRSIIRAGIVQEQIVSDQSIYLFFRLSYYNEIFLFMQGLLKYNGINRNITQSIIEKSFKVIQDYILLIVSTEFNQQLGIAKGQFSIQINSDIKGITISIQKFLSEVIHIQKINQMMKQVNYFLDNEYFNQRSNNLQLFYNSLLISNLIDLQFYSDISQKNSDISVLPLNQDTNDMQQSFQNQQLIFQYHQIYDRQLTIIQTLVQYNKNLLVDNEQLTSIFNNYLNFLCVQLNISFKHLINSYNLISYEIVNKQLYCYYLCLKQSGLIIDYVVFQHILHFVQFLLQNQHKNLIIFQMVGVMLQIINSKDQSEQGTYICSKLLDSKILSFCYQLIMQMNVFTPDKSRINQIQQESYQSLQELAHSSLKIIYFFITTTNKYNSQMLESVLSQIVSQINIEAVILSILKLEVEEIEYIQVLQKYIPQLANICISNFKAVSNGKHAVIQQEEEPLTSNIIENC